MKVRHFDTFEPGNDPYGEHDFGAFTACGRKIYWKIDTYDKTMTYASPAPWDPMQSRRVLTILRADEY